jgi:hypothetical protein
VVDNDVDESESEGNTSGDKSISDEDEDDDDEDDDEPVNDVDAADDDNESKKDDVDMEEKVSLVSAKKETCFLLFDFCTVFDQEHLPFLSCLQTYQVTPSRPNILCPGATFLAACCGVEGFFLGVTADF